MTFRQKFNKVIFSLLFFLVVLNGCGPSSNEDSNVYISVANPTDNSDECVINNYKTGDVCGSTCPVDQCEDLEHNNGLPLDSWINYLSVYDGICIDEGEGIRCKTGICDSSVTFTQTIDCTDTDADGVMDIQDFDDSTPYNCDICESDEIGTANCQAPERLGVAEDITNMWCNSDPSLNKCMNAGGLGGVTGPLNLQIIVTPCNFNPTISSLPQRTFEDVVTYFAAELAKLEPFASNQNKYTITYLWSLEKEYGDLDKTDDNLLDLCFDRKTTWRLSDTCRIKNNPNVVYLHLFPTDGGDGGGANIILEGDVSKSTVEIFGSGILGLSPGSSADINHFMFNTLHELGHTFDFSHASFSTVDPASPNCVEDSNSIHFSNDIYIAEIPNNPMSINELPCPLWKSEVYGRWITSEEKIGCYPYYFGCKNYYKAWNSGDVLSSGYTSGEDILKYNPVQRKFIYEILDEGYVNYIKKHHANRCIELGSQQEIDSCLFQECAYIPIEDTQNRQSCCNKISDQSLIPTCYQNVLQNAPDLGEADPDAQASGGDGNTGQTKPTVDSNDPNSLILPYESIPYSVSCQGNGGGCPLVSDTTVTGRDISTDYWDTNYPNPNLLFEFNPPIKFKKGLKMLVVMDHNYYSTAADIDVRFGYGYSDSDYVCHFNYVNVEQLSDSNSFMLIDLYEKCKQYEGIWTDILSVNFKPTGNNNGYNLISDVSFYFDGNLGLPDVESPTIDNANPSLLLLPATPIPYEFSCFNYQVDAPCGNLNDELPNGRNIGTAYIPAVLTPLIFNFNQPMKLDDGLKMNIHLGCGSTKYVRIALQFLNGQALDFCEFDYDNPVQDVSCGNYMLIDLFNKCNSFGGRDIIQVQMLPLNSNQGQTFYDVSFYNDLNN